MEVKYRGWSRNLFTHYLLRREINDQNLNDVEKTGWYSSSGINIKTVTDRYGKPLKPKEKLLELSFRGSIQDSNYLFTICFTPNDLLQLLPYILVILKDFKLAKVLKIFQNK